MRNCEIVQYVVNRTINMNKLLACRYYSCYVNYIKIWFELKLRKKKKDILYKYLFDLTNKGSNRIKLFIVFCCHSVEMIMAELYIQVQKIDSLF